MLCSKLLIWSSNYLKNSNYKKEIKNVYLLKLTLRFGAISDYVELVMNNYIVVNSFNTNVSSLESAIEYYQMKYNNNLNQAFVHLVREIGQIAFGMETNNNAVLEAKFVEAEALLRFLAYKYEIDANKNVEAIYSKKISKFEKRRDKEH